MECNDIKRLNDSSFNSRSNVIGLTDYEVNERVLKGEVNRVPKAPSRTLWQMIRANFFNIFNAINAVLALVCVIAGSPKNAIFAGVIIVNSVIGLGQELYAKKTLEKLSLLSMAKANVLRNGKVKEISVEELVLDDVVYLNSGTQVLADCEIIDEDELEIDESMLTGEADSVYKRNGDKILSGSFVIAGEGYARIERIGLNTYSSKLADEARKFKIINSELQQSISKVIRLLLWLIIPIGLILTTTQIIFTGIDWRNAIIGVVSGIVGMIPEGLVLLASATFIVSVIKLSKYNTLVQQLSTTEVLARVDVLCVDKTGTITEGKLKLVDIKKLDKDKDIELALASLVHNLPSKNPTQDAILERYPEVPNIEITEKISFSSRRKWGGIILKGKGAWVMGAPEILLGSRYNEIKDNVEYEAKKGRRVLLLGKIDQLTLRDGLLGEIKEKALILIEDVIKDGASEVLKYFKDEGVQLKIISGDNPVTVSAVAMRTGVEGYENYIDARELPNDINEIAKVVDKYTIFGRVTPHQKKDIVKALQLKGHTVSMTGDGVNDVLALKESDCGIAMGSGSEASKAVAQLVLLNSDFGALPKVLLEGRKQINNLERVAELFLSKTVFFICLAVIFSLMMIPYPLLPIQASLVGSCAIGIPSFFLALLPSVGRVKNGFLKRILTTSIPNGIVMVMLTTLGYSITYFRGASIEHSRTVALLIFAGISLVILTRISLPITKFKLILLMFMIFCVLICYFTPLFRVIFSLTTIKANDIMLAFILVLISWPLIHMSVKFVRKFTEEKANMKMA